jgi:hypothetical protein
MYNKDKGVIISGFDVLDTVRFIDKKAKRHLATLLSELEGIIEDREQYLVVRKLVLDSVNNLIRSIVRSIFGDIE